MGHLPSQPHVLPQEPRAAGANVPYMGSEHMGGTMRDPADLGGAVTWGCRRDAGHPPARVRLCRSAHGGSVRDSATCCGVHGHVLPPKYCFSCLGGLPQALPPPQQDIILQLCWVPSLSAPQAGSQRSHRGFSGHAGQCQRPRCPRCHRPPPLSTSRCSQVKNVADGASVQDETATLAYSEKPTSPINAPPYSAPSYSYAPPNTAYYPSGTYSSRG